MFWLGSGVEIGDIFSTHLRDFSYKNINHE